MLTFHNLKRVGLLVEKEPATTHTKNLNKLAAVANIPKSSNFRALCKKLHLVMFTFSFAPYTHQNFSVPYNFSVSFSHKYFDFSLQIPKSAEEINLKMPTDMSYVFSGAFSPPICKLIEQVVFFVNIII